MKCGENNWCNERLKKIGFMQVENEWKKGCHENPERNHVWNGDPIKRFRKVKSIENNGWWIYNPSKGKIHKRTIDEMETKIGWYMKTFLPYSLNKMAREIWTQDWNPKLSHKISKQWTPYQENTNMYILWIGVIELHLTCYI